MEFLFFSDKCHALIVTAYKWQIDFASFLSFHSFLPKLLVNEILSSAYFNSFGDLAKEIGKGQIYKLLDISKIWMYYNRGRPG